MAGNSKRVLQPARTRTPLFLLATALLLFVCTATTTRAALQFDVFVGYDGIVPEASWFPVVCEIKNDGPTFTGTIELTGGAYSQGQTAQAKVELPTGTLKRLVIPAFSATRGYSSWDVHLYDERGRVRAEQTNVRARKQLAHGTPIIGAISRTPSGAPVLRQVAPQATEMQPTGARLLPSIFPDNPLVLEGLSCLYLNSERAADLSLNQVNAIFAWVHAGGHLVVAVEQPSEITASPWLKKLFPCDVKDLRTLDRHPELQDWVRSATWKTNAESAVNPQTGPNSPQNQFRKRYGIQAMPGQASPTVQPAEVTDFFGRLPLDLDFESAPMQVAVGQLREGTVEIGTKDAPLMVSSHRGRGMVTGLMFSPEREPVRGWKNLDMFWARVAEVPSAWYVSKDFNLQGGWGSDGIFGGMIDTRQVHKLPVGWLLLLLIVYLVVIGPFDQYWLKRIGKPMLTWITFPCYVVLFSLIIYFIGYKLRAGESEWNELHLVDILQDGERAELRGRTYSSVYSPSNQRYTLESQQKYATLRGEFAGLWSGGQSSSERATVVQNGDSFKAEIFVPVWTSELYISDWWQPAPLPLTASVTPQAQGWKVKIENRTDKKLANIQLVIEERIVLLGELEPGQARTLDVSPQQGTLLSVFVSNHAQSFQGVVNSRQRALGASESGQISDLPNCSMAASFLSQLPHAPYQNNFVSPPGLDLSSVLDHGGAVILAWAADYAPVKPMYQFSPRRSMKHTLWRLAVIPGSKV